MRAVFPASGSPHAAYIRLAVWGIALVCGWIGCMQVLGHKVLISRWMLLGDVPLSEAAGWWVAALVFGAIAQFIGRARAVPTFVLPDITAPDPAVRWRLVVVAVPFLAGAFFLQTDVEFTFSGVVCWLAGLILLCAGFMLPGARPLHAGMEALRRFPSDKPYTALALAAILAIAAFARVLQLPLIPPELIPDQIENLVNVQQILDGRRDIFFMSNGGREPLHLYLTALTTPLTGGANFSTLKLTAVFESLAGVLVFYGLGNAIIGDGSRRASNFGLALALVGAVGYWYIVLTRVTLRLLLTPPLTALILWALIRLIRHNRRQDAVITGLLLGVGFYSYQAMRIAPLLAIMAAAIGILWAWRKPEAARTYTRNLVIAGIITIAVCLPLFRYLAHDSGSFWKRWNITVVGEAGGCFGSENGECPNASNAWTLFSEGLWRTVLMFTYRGDVYATYNAPGYPVVDPVGGALLLSGMGAAAVYTLRRRDPVMVFLGLSFFIMLMPGVVTLARQDEVPNSIRTSGAMPVLYAVIAFGLMNTVNFARAALPLKWRSGLLVVAIPALAAFSMFNHAWGLVSTTYVDFIQGNSVSHREVGQLMRVFADETGTWGNIYFVHSPHFLDFRAVMIEAGLRPNHYPNINVLAANIPAWLYANSRDEGISRFNPQQDLMFVFSSQDETTLSKLAGWFPDGIVHPFWTRAGTRYESEYPMVFFRVPALGRANFIEFLRQQNVQMQD